MAFRKVLLLQSQKLKKRQFDSATPGAFSTLSLYMSVRHTVVGWWGLNDAQKTVKCKMLIISQTNILQHLPQNTPKGELQDEVMECILNWVRWLQTENDLILLILSSLLSLPPSIHLPSIPPLRVCDLWSKASRQQRCRLVVQRERERESDGRRK